MVPHSRRELALKTLVIAVKVLPMLYTAIVSPRYSIGIRRVDLEGSE